MAALIDSVTGQDEDKCECCNCDFKTRMIGGVICVVVGFVFTWLAFIIFIKKNYAGFSVLYVIGAGSAIASTFFFAGWKKQIREFKKNRPFLISGICVVVCLLLLLILGNVTKNLWVVLIFLILQWIAQIFYCITAIPGGWTGLKTVFGVCCKSSGA